ncbi:hypothetical protein [Micromonospora avicenniae]|uniref:Uncharacterized protein n=1 Tax=Micromonospora avicenniae TaxID=1198245 RepID=A0A1N7DCD7_9ACTN|nr:hypothetical protein [Micromonospora avicenniae]SIR73513.1 hypothetical protein SAMN05444858_11624 [Micromonospora avicenniae]
MTYSPVSLRQAYHWHRPLMFVAATMVALGLVSLVGLVVDDRMLVGAPIWLKPFKFALSFLFYLVTLSWLISLMRRGRRIGWWAGTIVAVTGFVEVGLIAVQAGRGQQSHFNVATPLDTAVFGLMAVLIAVLYSASLVLAVLLMVQRMPDRAIAWALRLGLLIALVGMGLGYLMVMPTPGQEAAEPVTLVGAHSVGVPDGGPGMPITGWSTTGGDLRIPHFVGMHALQALPLLAIGIGLLAGRLPRLRDGGVRLRLMLVAAGAYAGLVALVTWQALRGQPLIHPDGVTLVAAGALAAVTAVGVLLALRRPAPQPSTKNERPEVYA